MLMENEKSIKKGGGGRSEESGETEIATVGVARKT